MLCALRTIFQKCAVLIRRRGMVALVAVALLLIVPQTAKAGVWFGLEDLSYGFVNGLLFNLSWLISKIFGVIIMIEGFVLQVVLTLSISVVNSSAVRLGFPVVLSLANLAFVLGLVVMIIATIIGFQSYGMKNLLWKLMVMAIGVNLGLVICGIILGFSDSITIFLINSVVPGGGGESWWESTSKFGDTLAGAFNPQRSFIFNADEIGAAKELESFQKEFGVIEGAGAAELLRPIIGIFLSIATLLIMVAVLGGLVIMLLIRYVKLAFALISLPMAWAMWPFPAFSHYTKQWWDGFLKQAFFPPIVVFTLWLGMTIAQELAVKERRDAALHLTAIKSSGPGQAADGFLGGLMGGLLDQFIVVAVIGGIMTMGIVTAQSFGIQFAGATLNAARAGQNRMKKELATRSARGAKRVGRAVQERTMPLQRLAVGTRRYSTAAVGQGAAAAKLWTKNKFLSRKNREEDLARLGMTGTVFHNNRPVGEAKWDHDKHDWKRDENGDIIAHTATGAVIAGRVGKKAQVTGAKLEQKDSHGHWQTVRKLDQDQVKKFGLASGNKPITEFVNARFDTATGAGDLATSDITNVRAVATPTWARLEHTMHEMEVEPGQIMSDAQKKVMQERAKLRAEAEHSGGVFYGFAAAPLVDTAKALGAGGGDGGGHGHAKKDDHGDKHDKKGHGAAHH